MQGAGMRLVHGRLRAVLDDMDSRLEYCVPTRKGDEAFGLEQAKN